jgi:RNA-binding protein
MLTGKQRSYLKGLAHSLKPMAQLGKDGLSEAFVNQLSELLDLHELVKVNVLDNSSEDAQEVALEVVKLLDAEFVQCIGHKFIIYRQSRTNPMLEIPGADNKRVYINRQKKAVPVKKEEKLSKKGGKISKPLQVKRSKARKEKLEKVDNSSVNKSRTRGRSK